MKKSSSESSRVKRMRLNDLSRGSYASHRAIESLLLAAREGLPKAVSRTTQWRARKDAMNRQTPYGPLVQTMVMLLSSGVEETIGVQHPWAMLHVACAESVDFANLMRETYAQTGDKPWQLIFYCDEIGFSPLQHDTRKICAWYWSFLDFGTDKLSTDDLWFVVAVVRSDLLSDFPGSTGHVSKRLLKEFFFTNDHQDIRQAGFVLHVHGAQRPIGLSEHSTCISKL